MSASRKAVIIAEEFESEANDRRLLACLFARLGINRIL